MKKLVLALALMGCLPAHADTAAEIYKQGLIAVEEGNVKAADTAFREVLRLQPGNANARHQLNQLKANQGSIAARARAKKLGEFTIDQVDFSDTELSEALAALTVMIEEKSKKTSEKDATVEFSPNFMIQDSSNKLGETVVTLQVKNVPAKAVFDMLLKQAGGVAKYEEHAIVVRPVPRGGD